MHYTCLFIFCVIIFIGLVRIVHFFFLYDFYKRTEREKDLVKFLNKDIHTQITGGNEIRQVVSEGSISSEQLQKEIDKIKQMIEDLINNPDDIKDRLALLQKMFEEEQENKERLEKELNDIKTKILLLASFDAQRNNKKLDISSFMNLVKYYNNKGVKPHRVSTLDLEKIYINVNELDLGVTSPIDTQNNNSNLSINSSAEVKLLKDIIERIQKKKLI